MVKDEEEYTTKQKTQRRRWNWFSRWCKGGGFRVLQIDKIESGTLYFDFLIQ